MVEHIIGSPNLGWSLHGARLFHHCLSHYYAMADNVHVVNLLSTVSALFPPALFTTWRAIDSHLSMWQLLWSSSSRSGDRGLHLDEKYARH